MLSVKKKLQGHSYMIFLITILVVLIMVLSIASPFFLSWKNCRNILNQSAIYLVLSVGMTFVICMGEIDLSVGAIIGFSGMIMGMLCVAGVPSLTAALLGLAVSALIGVINGALVAYGKISSFIVTYKETTLISDAFNQMLGRLKKLDDSRQEFVSNVSHELKTPLTSMKVLSDSLLSQEEVPVELYREFMGDLSEEIERENKIINDLLSLVKMDKTAATMNIRSENINELIEKILKRLQPLASEANVEVVYESFRPVTAEVDEVKLSLAISNLVENAIKYNRENGWVHVSLNADHKYVYIEVADSGIGIPETETEHIFERFYRVDKSHSREIGGSGLGLSIARNAVVMHRGAIKVFSQPGEGTTFSVRIPINYAG